MREAHRKACRRASRPPSILEAAGARVTFRAFVGLSVERLQTRTLNGHAVLPTRVTASDTAGAAPAPRIALVASTAPAVATCRAKILPGTQAATPFVMTRTLVGAAAIWLLASGCGSHMQDPTERLQDELSRARDESTLHRDRSVAATTLGEEMTELARYEQAMDPIVADMHGSLGDMSLCTASMSAMHAKTNALGDMMGEHRTRMQAALSLDEARDEAVAHHGTMLEMLDSMDAMAGDMSCMGDAR